MFMKRNKHQGWKNLSTKTKVLKAAGGFNILTYIYIYIYHLLRERGRCDRYVFFHLRSLVKTSKEKCIKNVVSIGLMSDVCQIIKKERHCYRMLGISNSGGTSLR